MNSTLRAGRRTLEITHADRVLFPGAITKLELARYYVLAAPSMLPHLRGRPLTLQSYPAGVERPGYMWKAIPSHFPDWISRVEVTKAGGTVTHALAQDAATLAYLANQNCVVVHAWTSRADRLDRPDLLIVDLDPAGTRFSEVRAAAREVGELLRDRGLSTFVKTSGSRGLHVVCPLRRTAGHDAVLAFARQVAGELAASHPRRLTTEQRKANRGQRIYLDVARNAYAQTAVVPYSARAAAGAPVAVPLHWEELDDRRLRPDGWTIRSVGPRLSDDDPWKTMRRSARSLPPLRPV